MKKKILIGTIFLVCFSFLVYAISQGGTQSDPLVTESQVNSVFKENIDEYVNNKVVFPQNIIENKIASLIKEDEKIAFVKNDTITELDMGDMIIVTSGDFTISGAGSIINLSNGNEIFNPLTLEYNTQYLVTENSNFTITSTSINTYININGNYSYSNPYVIEYLDYANALSQLGLFQGTAYGFQLDKFATRIEAVIMFIRLIGEEEMALSCELSHPFNDVPSWATKYVAYAFNKGYVNGMTENEYGSTRIVRDLDYYTFVLRALGYKDSEDFNWSTANETAQNIGIIPTDFGIYSELYRDQLAYISYNSLNLYLKNEDFTLAEHLIFNEKIELSVYENLKDLLITN